MVRVLQTLALPLGHDAVKKTERAMRFELTTFSLARRRTTTVLRPQVDRLYQPCAETQNRTVDTAIFSRVLYQLSYLGDILWLSVRNFTLGVWDCQASLLLHCEEPRGGDEAISSGSWELLRDVRSQ